GQRPVQHHSQINVWQRELQPQTVAAENQQNAGIGSGAVSVTANDAPDGKQRQKARIKMDGNSGGGTTKGQHRQPIQQVNALRKPQMMIVCLSGDASIQTI